jgi:hypothetical protein
VREPGTQARPFFVVITLCELRVLYDSGIPVSYARIIVIFKSKKFGSKGRSTAGDSDSEGYRRLCLLSCRHDRGGGGKIRKRVLSSLLYLLSSYFFPSQGCGCSLHGGRYGQLASDDG